MSKNAGNIALAIKASLRVETRTQYTFKYTIIQHEKRADTQSN